MHSLAFAREMVNARECQAVAKHVWKNFYYCS
jgi:hypothetical protein